MLKLLDAGLSISDIADDLQIHQNVARQYFVHCERKLGTRGLEDTVAAARRRRQVLTISPREQQVARLIAEGKTFQQAADEIGIAFRTAKTLMERVRAKLNISDSQEAAARLQEWGLL